MTLGDFVLKYNTETEKGEWLMYVPSSYTPTPVPTEPRIDIVGNIGNWKPGPYVINSKGQVWRYFPDAQGTWRWINLHKTAKDIACSDFDAYIIGTDNKIYEHNGGESVQWTEITPAPPLIPTQITVDSGGVWPGLPGSLWIVTKYYTYNVIFKYNWGTKNWDYISVQLATDIAAGT